MLSIRHVVLQNLSRFILFYLIPFSIIFCLIMEELDPNSSLRSATISNSKTIAHCRSEKSDARLVSKLLSISTR